jgi:type III secretion protein SpaR/YscT/HrcT
MGDLLWIDRIMTDSYLEVFFTNALTKGDPTAVLSLLFLFLGRILPIIALSPFFGGRVLPNPTKVCFAFTLFVIFLPTLLQVSTKPLGFNTTLFLYLFKEVFVGFSIGLMISIPFLIAQGSGIIIDHQRGGASLMTNDATVQNQSSPLGMLFNMTLIWIFYFIDGPFLFIEAIIESYTVIPPDQFFNPVFFSNTSAFWKQIIQLFNQMMIITIQISTPALIAILMTDAFLGIANRLAPQVQITFLGMPLKSLLGLLVICMGWQLIATEFAKQSMYWVAQVVDLLRLFAGST